MNNCEEPKLTRTKSRHRWYVEMVDYKYADIVCKEEKTLEMYATMKVLRLKEFVDDEVSSYHNWEAERKWEGRIQVVRGGPQAGILDFRENEGNISLYAHYCPPSVMECMHPVKAA